MARIGHSKSGRDVLDDEGDRLAGVVLDHGRHGGHCHAPVAGVAEELLMADDEIGFGRGFVADFSTSF
jgi:hypothetical protein